jgi:hypothetical protein
MQLGRAERIFEEYTEVLRTVLVHGRGPRTAARGRAVKNIDRRTRAGAASVLGRSLGSAVRLVRQLVPDHAGRVGARPSLARRSEHERARRRLVAEIAQLEAEVERLHSMIISNAVPMRGDGARRSLKELLDASRQKRELAYEKRQELLRVERHLDRESRLRPLEPVRDRARAEGPVRLVQKGSPRGSGTRTERTVSVGRAARGSSRAQPERIAFDRLVQRLRDPDPDIRREAVLRLSALGSPEVPELLLTALDDQNDRVRLSALNALVGSNHRAAADAFRRYVQHENPALRLAALRGLASLDARYLPTAALVDRLEDPDPSVRRTAAELLGWRRHDRATSDIVHALALALHDDDRTVRAAAVQALGTLADDRGVLSLIQATLDVADDVRDVALGSLRAMVGGVVDRLSEGRSPAERAAALKEWWKTARADVCLAAHEGDVAVRRREVVGPPAPGPPVPVAPTQGAPSATAQGAAVRPSSTGAGAGPSAAAPRKEPPVAPDAAAAEATVRPETPVDPGEGMAAMPDESAEDFETMFMPGDEDATDAAGSGGSADAGAPEPQAEGADTEDAEEGAFEDLFGGGDEEKGGEA